MKTNKAIRFAVLFLAFALLTGCGGGGSSAPAPPANPTVTIVSPGPIGLDNATLKGKVNPNGDNTVAWFEVGSTSATLTKVSASETNVGFGSNDVDIAYVWTGLSQGTTYYFRVGARNSVGATIYGATQNFTTTVLDDPPSANIIGADNIAKTTARVRASVNPNGLSTSARFEYSLNASFSPLAGFTDNQTLTGSASTDIQANLTSLTAGTKYYYRVKATNAAGTTTTADGANFTTLTLVPPTANAGDDQEVYMFGPWGLRTITLSGSSTPGDGTISGYQWTKLSGTSITLTDDDEATATFDAPKIIYPDTSGEDFLFNLTVTDSNSKTGSDNVAVRVKWGFRDDFSVDSTATYAKESAAGTGGTFTYVSGAARANATAGNGILFAHDFDPGKAAFPDPIFSATQGVFSFNYSPGIKYGSSLIFDVMIGESYGTCYRINAADGEIQKWRGGTKVDSAAFAPTLTEGAGYWVKLSFEPGNFTVTITSGNTTQTFGPLTDDTTVSVERFAFQVGSQRADFDNIVLDVLY